MGADAEMEDDDSCSLPVLFIKFREFEKRQDLHRIYLDKALEKAAKELAEKLIEMNQFREENRKLTQQFATNSQLDERTQVLTVKIQSLADHIEEGIGKRLTLIELYRANLDGRFWVWGVFITVLTLLLQFWPFLKGKS